MKLEEHCQRSLETFGKRYEEIHLWLDEFADQYSYSDRYKHRKHRHHKEGIMEVYVMFGYEAAMVAKQHIKDDNQGYLPRKRDYDIIEYGD